MDSNLFIEFSKKIPNELDYSEELKYNLFCIFSRLIYNYLHHNDYKHD